MKYILIFSLLLSYLHADKMLKETLGCPSVLLLKKAPLEKEDNYLDLSNYAIANNCVILSRKSSVEAIGYDPLNSKEIFQKIIYNKTSVYLYIKSSSILIEQSGKKGTVRF